MFVRCANTHATVNNRKTCWAGFGEILDLTNTPGYDTIMARGAVKPARPRSENKMSPHGDRKEKTV